MAAIQNDRDVLLQAAAIRVVPVVDPRITDIEDAVKGVEITAPSTVFQIAAVTGTPSPGSILLTAKTTLMAAGTTLTWDVTVGSATLLGTGTTRTLLASRMDSSSVTIRVRAQEPGSPVIYTALFTVAKVTDGKDGTDGTDGTAGQRGSITAYGVLAGLQNYPLRDAGKAQWSDGVNNPTNATKADNIARNIIWTALGNAGTPVNNNHLFLGDTVTLTNTAQTVSATGYWTGAAWDHPGTVLNGNLLVGGNIAGQEFTGGVFTGGVFRTSNSNKRIELSASGLRAYSGSYADLFILNTDTGYMFSVSGDSVATYEVRNTGGAPGVSGYSAIDGYSINGIGGKFTSENNHAISGYSLNGIGGKFTSVNNHAISGIASNGTTGTGPFAGVLGAGLSVAHGLYGKSEKGAGGVFEATGGVMPAIRLVPVSSLPSDKALGGLCFHTTHGLCFADGTNWHKLTGTTVL